MNILTAYKLLYLLLSVIGGGILKQSVTFESMESKTAKGQPVFNTISFVKKDNIDIWKMDQSHHGIHAKDWDHIEIHVKDNQVSYHQIKDNREIEYKADCLRCHVSGPRMIRPKVKSHILSLKFEDKMTIFAWNLLIKSYGDLKVSHNAPFKREKPLIVSHEKINVKSCSSCHYKGGPRSELTFEHKGTIKFLLNSKQMPPWPYKITKADKKELQKIIYGF